MMTRGSIHGQYLLRRQDLFRGRRNSPPNTCHRRICLLTHPRQFETNWGANTRDNLVRLYEGLTW